jgi:uncharacterized membrane protein
MAADMIGLLNATIIDQSSIDEISNSINLLTNLFKALGGIFIVGVIAWIISLKNIIKQKKMLEELNRKIDRLIKKRR